MFDDWCYFVILDELLGVEVVCEVEFLFKEWIGIVGGGDEVVLLENFCDDGIVCY